VGHEKFIVIWDVAKGKPIRQIESWQQYGGNRIAFSPADNTLASGSQDIRIWDLATGKELRRIVGHRQGITSLAFSPDGKSLASGGSDQIIRQWDAATGKELRQFKGHQSNVLYLFFPNGKTLLSGSWDNTIRVWDVVRDTERRQFTVDRVYSVTISRDGKIAATGGYDQTMRLWEVATGKEVRQFRGHRGEVSTIAFSPDGRAVASGGSDTTVLVWDITGSSPDGRLPEVNLRDEEREALWTDLAGGDPAKGYRAIWTLIAERKRAVSFLQSRLRPVPDVKRARISKLIADLDHQRFDVREDATHELELLGEQAESALQQVLERKPSLEVRRRVERLLQVVRGPMNSPDRLRTFRAIQVLEHIGTPEAQDVLRTLAKGAAEARLTQEAKASLERLAKRAAITP
jgi:WD40 repeat protein